jgi:hypothetical protein
MGMGLTHANHVSIMGQLSASMAHDVNQPIGAAVTNAHAAVRWLGATPPNIDMVRRLQPPGGERRANLSGPQHDQARRVGNGPVDLPLDCRSAPRTIAGRSERGSQRRHSHLAHTFERVNLIAHSAR